MLNTTIRLHPARLRADCAASVGGARAHASRPVVVASDPTIQQTTLTDNTTTTDEPATTSTTTTVRKQSANARTILAPPDQRGDDDCCPWCLAAADTFEYYADNRARCGYCDASIPTNADWYKHDEKIAV